jgi:hypothetical protein
MCPAVEIHLLLTLEVSGDLGAVLLLLLIHVLIMSLSPSCYAPLRILSWMHSLPDHTLHDSK